ncbi:MAG: leucine-rich repeat domain-containing protein, partial [Clostridia bacterium]|nr:leucine-rich repeat domain-containing protein [Clostridia bacterium]
MKKLLILLAALIFITGSAASGEDDYWPPLVEDDNDIWPAEYDYILNADGTAEITAYIGRDRVLTLPDEIEGYRVSGIGSAAFAGSRMLESVTLPEGITYLSDEAFQWCPSLVHVSLPSSLTGIGVNPFISCGSLSTIDISPDNPELFIQDGALCSRSDGRLIFFPLAADADSFDVPHGIEIIGQSAFEYCDKLKRVCMSDSLRSIDADAFSFCSQLADIELNDELEAIGDGAFWYCVSLKQIKLPDSLTFIGENPFNACKKLEGLSVS